MAFLEIFFGYNLSGDQVAFFSSYSNLKNTKKNVVASKPPILKFWKNVWSFMVIKYTAVNFFRIFGAELCLKKKIKAVKHVFEVRKKLWSDWPILTMDSDSATPKTYSLLGGVGAFFFFFFFFFVWLCNFCMFYS